MVRLLHLADVHLGWQPRFVTDPAVAQRYVSARHAAFDAALNLAGDRSRQVDVVVIAGDLFDDHRPAAALVEHVIAGLARLVAQGVHVISVPGNHDEITYGDSVYRSYASRWPGVLVSGPAMTHVVSLRCRDDDLHVYGMAYTGGITQVKSPLRDFPRSELDGVHLAVLHGTVTAAGTTGWLASERSLPLDATALAAAGYDYVALGHLHKPGPAAPPRRDGIAYAGMMASRGFDDPGCGSVPIVAVGTHGRVSTERVPVDVPPTERITVRLDGVVDGEAALAHVARHVQGLKPGVFVEICLTGGTSVPVDGEAMAAAATATGIPAFVALRDETSLLSANQVRQWAGESTLRGFYVRRFVAEEPDGDGSMPGGPEAEDEAATINRRALRYGLAALLRGRR